MERNRFRDVSLFWLESLTVIRARTPPQKEGFSTIECANPRFRLELRAGRNRDRNHNEASMAGKPVQASSVENRSRKPIDPPGRMEACQSALRNRNSQTNSATHWMSWKKAPTSVSMMKPPIGSAASFFVASDRQS